MSRLALAKSMLRFNWRQADIPDVLSRRGIEVRGAGGAWRLLASAKAHPLLSDFVSWAKEMVVRAEAEEGALQGEDPPGGTSHRHVPVTPFLSKVYWHLVQYPSIGSVVWARFRDDPGCPYTHHTQFLGDLGRLALDASHPLPVVWSRFRSRHGSILMAAPVIYHVSESVSDDELELEGMLQAPQAFAPDHVTERIKLFEKKIGEKQVVVPGKLIRTYESLRRGAALPDLLAELDKELRRRERVRRVWAAYYQQATNEFAATLLAALGDNIVDNYVMLPESLVASPGFCDFLCWLSAEGATTEVPRWPHRRIAREIHTRRVHAIRTMPPYSILEHANMLRRGLLDPSPVSRRVMEKTTGIVPEAAPRLLAWLQQHGAASGAVRGKTVQEILARIWPRHGSRQAPGHDETDEGRHSSVQAPLRIDWNPVDFST